MKNHPDNDGKARFDAAEFEATLATIPERAAEIEHWKAEAAQAAGETARLAQDDGRMSPVELVRLRREAADRAEAANIYLSRAKAAAESAMHSLSAGLKRAGAAISKPLAALALERQTALHSDLVAMIGVGASQRHTREIANIARDADSVKSVRDLAALLDRMRMDHAADEGTLTHHLASLKQAAAILDLSHP